MKIKQYEKDGSCDIEFSWKERFFIITRGKIHLSPLGLRHFGNMIVRIVSEWNMKFNKEIANTMSDNGSEIK